jgi:hypothetical protein
MIEVILYLLVLLIGVPVGILLIKLCSDEIKNWKFRLKIMSLISIILSMGLVLSDFEFKIPSIIGLLFIVVVNLVIVRSK